MHSFSEIKSVDLHLSHSISLSNNSLPHFEQYFIINLLNLYNSNIYKLLYHSTIFRTIDENAKGAINKYGIGNGSYADIVNAFKSGGISGATNSTLSFITSKDLKNIKEYNRLVSEEGVSSQTAWYKTMQKSSNTAKELFDNEQNLVKSGNSVVLSEEAIADATNTMTIGAKAANVAMKGLAIAGNMILMWGISEAISALYKFSQVSKDVANSAQEIGSSFKETQTDIDSYKEKVEELRGVINNSSSSVSEVTQARKDLMAVQDELIEKFGTEKESINAITEAINGQTGAWEKLTSKKWQEAKNEFNGKGGIIKDISNLTKGYGDNIERMQDEYGKYEETIDFGSISGDKNRQKAEELLKNFGEFSKTSAGIGNIKISGNATEVYEKILAIQETLDKMDVDFGKSFDNELTNKANKVKDVSDKYKDFYNQFVLNEKILNDNEKGYSDYFNQITKDYDDYKKAVDSNDTTKISEKESAFAKQVVDSMDAAIKNGDTDVADYFRNMYPELESIINDWDFKIKFSADTDNLKTDTQKAVDKLGGISKEQLLDFNPKTATEKQKEGYSDLITLSEKYHMSISELIDILEKLGLVSSTFNKELISKYSPDETSDKGIKNAKQTLKEDNQDDINNWLNELSDADKKIVQSTSFENALKQRQKELDGASLSLNEYKNALEKVKQTEGATASDTSKISFKQAWKDLDSTDDDSLKNLKKDLTTLAESGKLTEKSFNKTPGAKTWLEQLGIDAETAVDKINNLKSIDSTQQLSSLKTNIKLIQDAFADKRDNGVAGSDTINAMKPEFGKLKSWKKYKETLGSTTSTLNECRDAQNKLASEYVNNNNFLVKLVKSTGEVDDVTKAYYTSQLKELGIKNAKDVVDQQILNRQNEIHQKKSEEIIDIKTASTSLADATQDEIDSLVKEVEQLDGNTNALKLYLLQKMMSKDDAFDTEESVNNLISFANECDASKAVVGNLKNALKNLQENGNVKLGVGIDVSVNNPISGTILDGSFIKNGFPTLKESFINQQNNKEQQNYIDTAKSENEKRLRKQNKKLQAKINTLLKDAASSNSKSNGSSSSKSNTSKEFNWIDVLIKRTERKVQKSIDRITDYASKKTKNNLFGKALKAYGKEEKTYANASDFYLKKFNKVKISKNAKKDAEWKRKIKNGKLDIQTITNEKLADKISKAQDYYDNYLDYQDKQTGAKQNALALRKQKLDDDIAYIEAKSDRIQRLSDSVQNRIDNNDALGLATSENSYKELIKYSKKQVKRWIDEKATYAEYLSTLKRGSTEYIETEQKIADCDNKIQDAQKSQLEWNQTIAQMPLTALENFSNILSSIISGFGQLNSLLESQNKKLTDNDIKTAIESRNSLISSNQSEIEEYKGTQLTNAFRAIINAKYNGVYGAKIVNKEADPIAAKARSYIDQILAGTMSLDSFYAEMSKSTGMTIDYLKQSEGLTTILNSITNLNSDNYSLMQEQEEYTDKLIDNEIQNYQDLIDEMNKANDAKQKAIELTEKEIALQKALENRTNLIYRNGKYVYESDSSAVKEAKNNLDDYFAQRAIDKLQEVVDKLEDLKKDLNYRDGTGLLFASVDGLINYAKQRISKITGIPHYAKGTTSAKGGLSLTGENGTELRVLNRGDGIIPAEITKNLMEFGVDPAKMIMDNLNKNIPDYKNIITPVNTSTDNSIHIDKVEMSGVNDVQSFMKELSHLTLDAQQRAYKR